MTLEGGMEQKRQPLLGNGLIKHVLRNGYICKNAGTV
jgi:hypothetical protein